jgi:hypothetical protein
VGILRNRPLKNQAFVKRVKFTMSTPWSHIWGAYGQLHSLLIPAQDRHKWSTSRPARFTPGKERPYPLDAGWGQRQFGWFWTGGNFLSPPGIRHPGSWIGSQLHNTFSWPEGDLIVNNAVTTFGFHKRREFWSVMALFASEEWL